MELSIIVVSFNTKNLLSQTLKSIPKHDNWEIIVVDNASQDGSAELVASAFPCVKLIKNNTNLGFAKANNQGINRSRGEFVLLLNSDALAEDHAIQFLLEFIKRNPQIGIASGKLKNPDGSIQPQGGYLPRILNLFFWMFFLDDIPLLGKYLHSYQLRDPKVFENTSHLGWVSGTAMLIRKQVFQKVGLFDETFFMYGEDVEFCLRAQKKGFLVAITPESEFIHLKHKSSAGDRSIAVLGEFNALKIIFKKHKASWELPILKIILKVGALLRMFLFAILQDSKAYATYKKSFHMA